MAGFSLINLVKPILPILPEVELPYEKISFDDKMVYTISSGLIYLLTQFPLAGVSKDTINVNDPIYFLRGVFAAEPRTLLEFGIFPIVSSALILQLLAGLKYIKVNFKVQQDRELFQSLTKLFAFVQYFILANVFIFSGYYGENLSVSQISFLNFQLVGAGVFATLIIEVIDKGFGFTSGIMAINTLVIATSVVSDAFGFTQIPINAEGDKEAQGAFINLLQGFGSKHKTLVESIISAFNRDYLPNLATTLIVILIGAIVSYFLCYTIELAIRSTRARGMNNVYPVRLVYAGALSISFSYVLLFFIHVAAFTLIQVVANNDPAHIICKFLGHYETVNNILYVPSFPLSLLAPPRSFFGGVVSNPLSFVTFTLFVVVTGIWFSFHWQRISGASAKDLAVQFKDQGITLQGRREQNISKELDKFIPVAATTGAAVLALLTVAGELLGLKGKSAAIVVGVAGGFAILELVSVEYQQTGDNSALSQVFGVATGL